MEENTWAASLLLLGGLTFLLQGLLTLALAVPAYLFYQAPVGGYVLVFPPTSLQRFLMLSGVAASSIVLAYVIISSARPVYYRNLLLAKRRTRMAIVAAFVGVVVVYLASVIAFTNGTVNITINALFSQTGDFSDWGFVLTIAGAMLARWDMARSEVPPETPG